jgi:DNA polymerase III delta' subunit
MAFSDILGNSRVKKILRIALAKNKVPNSMLFCGPEGIGKRSMALVLAKAMNCEQKKDDACEVCVTCRAINSRSLPDVMEIFPEGNVIKIDQMRFLKRVAYLKPMTREKRVFIVDEVEKMTDEASNSLLKILEEPPLFSHIILLTSNPYLIMPTVKSRCQILNFSPVSKSEIEKILREKGSSEEKAKIISLLVRGNLEQALSLDWEEVQKKRNDAWEFFLSFLKKEETSLFLRNYAFSRRNLVREDLEQILEILSSFCRDLILVKEKGDPHLLLNPDYEKEIREKEMLAALERSLEFLDEIDSAISALNKNLNISLLVSSFYSQTMGWNYV